MSPLIAPPAVKAEASPSKRVITQTYRRFNELVWQPVAMMHPDWWQVLGLSIWQQRYQVNTVLGKRIETLVLKRYGLTQKPLPEHLTDEQAGLMTMADKLETLVIALGVLCLNDPEYLLLKPYRDALAGKLTRLQIQQIWSIWPQRPVLSRTARQTIAADDLLQQAFLSGIYHMDNYWQGDPLWQALSLRLPPDRLLPAERGERAATGAFDLPRWLFRLERLL